MGDAQSNVKRDAAAVMSCEHIMLLNCNGLLLPGAVGSVAQLLVMSQLLCRTPQLVSGQLVMSLGPDQGQHLHSVGSP